MHVSGHHLVGDCLVMNECNLASVLYLHANHWLSY